LVDHRRRGRSPSHLATDPALRRQRRLGPPRASRCRSLHERPADRARRAHRTLALVGRRRRVQPCHRALPARSLRRPDRSRASLGATVLAPVRKRRPPHDPAKDLPDTRGVQGRPRGLTQEARLAAYPIETHIAEKLHAYTRPPTRAGRENSRVRDLPDLALLASTRAIEAVGLRSALATTFAFRATHAVAGRFRRRRPRGRCRTGWEPLDARAMGQAHDPAVRASPREGCQPAGVSASPR